MSLKLKFPFDAVIILSIFMITSFPQARLTDSGPSRENMTRVSELGLFMECSDLQSDYGTRASLRDDCRRRPDIEVYPISGITKPRHPRCSDYFNLYVRIEIGLVYSRAGNEDSPGHMPRTRDRSVEWTHTTKNCWPHLCVIVSTGIIREWELDEWARPIVKTICDLRHFVFRLGLRFEV